MESAKLLKFWGSSFFHRFIFNFKSLRITEKNYVRVGSWASSFVLDRKEAAALFIYDLKSIGYRWGK